MPEPTQRERRPLRGGDLAAIVLALAVAGAIAYFWVQRRPAAPATPPAVPEQSAPAATPSTAPPSAAVQADPAQVKTLLEAASADPEYRRWLGAGGDLVRLWAVLTDNLAEGVSPRKQLPFLVPEQPFSVTEQGGRRVIASASYARYDRFGDAVASIDAKAMAAAYRALRPAVETAYRLLGYPDAVLDRVTARALHRLESAPHPGGPVEVVPHAEPGAGWAYADPALEHLGAVEKHLVRLGPRNASKVQAKAREIREALGLREPR
ncbi:conserved hypothetical protein [Anaeromyxobacter dehalogenans 2CP-1]|uniref:DUF3014 domain-containing protein n=1 Tax=Anaeromyxobacter dehalogenans (strain ATCC BAA-258 / DSM 21875 / 2CP-1) TaxID=455488 RepID=B8JB29_ANAD2|nr:DUF3014 domain-containing protein [Anaeromyxobacter dehalogenans]ACL63840.1 conserved hypothetical protein [Anaeromyxobacter dehalogenans 2CP-1]